MIEVAICGRYGVELRLGHDEARSLWQAAHAEAFEHVAIRDGRAFVLQFETSPADEIHIQSGRCRIAVDADGFDYLRFRLQQFLDLGHFSPPELWQVRDARTGRLRTVYLLEAAVGA